MIFETLLPSLEHLPLQVQVTEMLSSFQVELVGPLLLLLSNLPLDSVQLHAPVLLLHFVLVLLAHYILYIVHLDGLDCIDLRLVVHDVPLLLGCVGRSQILQSHVSSR